VPATDQARDSFGELVAAALPGLLRFGHVTWLIISGHPASPSRAAEALFLNRRGRVLLYNATSRPAAPAPRPPLSRARR
jgi:hypothetical protein